MSAESECEVCVCVCVCVCLSVCETVYVRVCVMLSAPPVVLQGRSFPVQQLYLEEPTSDFIQSALDTVLAIHTRVSEPT